LPLVRASVCQLHSAPEVKPDHALAARHVDRQGIAVPEEFSFEGSS